MLDINAMKDTLTYHNTVTADFETLFLQKNMDLLISDLRTKTENLIGNNLAVQLLVPIRVWRFYHSAYGEFLQEQFTAFIRPRLSEIFGDVPIKLDYSMHLTGDDISLSWGRSYSRSGLYIVTLQQQKLLSYEDETLVDDGILQHFGFEASSPFSLIIKENHLSIFRGQNDYEIKGTRLINKTTEKEFDFEITQDK